MDNMQFQTNINNFMLQQNYIIINFILQRVTT